MTDPISLHIPTLDELWYRQKLMGDPATMAYNKGYELSFDGYDRATGCMAFPREQWEDWYASFIGCEPERYYAYIVVDGRFIGEVNLHRCPSEAWHNMGIVIEAEWRGRGYSLPALRLLLREAFERLGVDMVRNEFEQTRMAALKTHLAAGFTEQVRKNGLVWLQISKQQYAALTEKASRHSLSRTE